MRSGRLRKLVAYTATGVFFFVAASGQLQGGPPQDIYPKAAAACVAIVILGKLLVYIVDHPGAANGGSK